MEKVLRLTEVERLVALRTIKDEGMAVTNPTDFDLKEFLDNDGMTLAYLMNEDHLRRLTQLTQHSIEDVEELIGEGDDYHHKLEHNILMDILDKVGDLLDEEPEIWDVYGMTDVVEALLSWGHGTGEEFMDWMRDADAPQWAILETYNHLNHCLTRINIKAEKYAEASGMVEPPNEFGRILFSLVGRQVMAVVNERGVEEEDDIDPIFSLRLDDGRTIVLKLDHEEADVILEEQK